MRAYFAEIHALHSFTTQRGTDRWRGRRLARADYQLDDLVFLDCFLGHGVGFLMVATPSLGASEVRNREWRKVSSLGILKHYFVPLAPLQDLGYLRFVTVRPLGTTRKLGKVSKTVLLILTCSLHNQIPSCGVF